jgi:hypothetical protein
MIINTLWEKVKKINYDQERQCARKVTLREVRATIVTVGKQ